MYYDDCKPGPSMDRKTLRSHELENNIPFMLILVIIIIFTTIITIVSSAVTCM